MTKISNAIHLIKENPDALKAYIVKMFSPLFSDRQYLSLLFRYRMGYSLDWENPETYNEKLQWLKINDRNPLYTQLVDKLEVKDYVSNLVGDSYVVKTLGVWNTPEEIDFSILPQQFVLKTTHGGGNGGVIICKDKSNLDPKKIRHTLSRSIRQDLFRDSREWPYKDVKKRIIAEEYLEDVETGELRDYKFFCFDGKVQALFVATERQKREEPFFSFFDRDYHSIDLTQGHPRPTVLPEKPALFDQMIMLAEELSKNISHVRIDLYQVNGHIYFGEYTFYHFGGMERFEPEKWDKIFGDWLTLPNVPLKKI